jgi:cytochrome c6
VRKHVSYSTLSKLVLMILLSASPVFAQDAALFTSKCAACHGKDGTAKTPMGLKLKVMDLNSPEVQKLSDAELKKVISDGKNKMPVYKEKLTQEQIASLVAYIRALPKK